MFHQNLLGVLLLTFVACLLRWLCTTPPPIPPAGVIAMSIDRESELRHWPQLYGPQRTSCADSVVETPQFPAGDLQVIWSLPVGTGYGSPVVSQGRVVFNHRVGDEDLVQCVDASTGKPIWSHRSASTFHCKFDYSSGPYSTPQIHGRDVFTVGGQGQVACLDLMDGEIKWKRELHVDFPVEESTFPVGATPLVVGQHLIFNLGASKADAGIVALDVSSGKTIWSATDHGAAYCTPFAATIHDQAFVFVMTDIGLVSLNPATGVVDWQIEHHSRSPMTFNAVSPLVAGEHVLAVAGPGPGAICVQVMPDRTYREVWKNRKVLDSQFNGLMLSAGNVLGFTTQLQKGAELRCVDFLTGELQWAYASPLKRGQGLIAGDAIVLVGEEGHFTLLKRSTKSLDVLRSWPNPCFERPCYCSPAICEEGLLVKNEEQLRMLRCWPIKD